MINFEDILFLFKSSVTNRDIIRMDLDEAGYLYSVVKKNVLEDRPCCVEIGRHRGGSTLLMAAAGGYVLSIDRKNDFDEEIREMLSSAKVSKLVKLVVADSSTFKYGGSVFRERCDSPHIFYEILFIDGDHSYDGVKADFKHWFPRVGRRGHILFHDSCVARKGARAAPGVEKFVKELIQKNNRLELVIQVGSITHFRRI